MSRPRSRRSDRSPKGVPLGFRAVEARTASYVEALARLSLFADLPHPQLEAVAHTFDEEVFAEGQRVIRQDMTGGGFYVIVDGEAQVVIDGRERARLTRGDFFGEISILAEEVPTADVVATSLLRCLIVPDNELKPFLLSQPTVMYRMLQIEARRLRAANVWAG
jgi:CRP/FNR family transcriptional regulator, cyclic AMP receptor protein